MRKLRPVRITKDKIWCRVCKKTLYKHEYGKRKTYITEDNIEHGLSSCPTLKIKVASYIDKAGYKVIYAPTSPESTTNGWAREHRVIMSNILGRVLKRTEHIHHINGIKTDNRPENLILVSIGYHTQLHNGNPNYRKVGDQNPLIVCACGCNSQILKYDKRGRPRLYIWGHNRK